MELGELLSENAVFIDSPVSSKAEAIELMVSVLGKEGRIKNTEKFKRAVLSRESEMATDVFEGISLPHARSAEVTKPSIAAVKLKDGLDNAQPDGAPIRLIFLVASPENSKEHLKALSSLSSALLNEETLNALKKAATADEFAALLLG